MTRSACARFVRERRPKTAVVVGAGYIGVEAADALRRNGLRRHHSGALGDTHCSRDDAAFTAAVRKQLERHGVELRTGVTVTAIEPDRVAGVPCDMVVMAGGLPAERGDRRGGRHRDRTQRRDSHRRAHGDQPARRVRRRRLRRGHPPGDRPAHLDSARHHRQQGRPRGGGLCRRRPRAFPGNRRDVDCEHLRRGLRDHGVFGGRRRAPKAFRRWLRASKPIHARAIIRA